MATLLGIDTGGTYTDAVLFDENQGVIGAAKALTTKYDLSIGIGQAVTQVLSEAAQKPDIRLVSVSTTLATNAIVEGQGSPICLMLLGYPPDTLEQSGLRDAICVDPIVFLDGGHSVMGEEQMPLDLDAAREAILAHAPKAAAFAVSGYFAVRNPAHELAVRDLVRELTDLPVTCGHELTSNLHAPRRALTVALNARLIPFLQQLILAVQTLLDEQNIHASLMVVKGDGSLVNAQVALERPVETILSGPAASVVGARYLSGEDNMVVVDMGGTTTDIATLRDGRPVLDLDGASVGGWRTMVEAVSVHTFGLGGDSEVRLEESESGGVAVGPRRVVPLSLLADQHPEVLDVLRHQTAKKTVGPYDGQFLLRQRPLHAGHGQLSDTEEEIWAALERGPAPLMALFPDTPRVYFLRQGMARLMERGLAVKSGFTPSDAAHVLGCQADWSQEAAGLGAELWRRAGVRAGQERLKDMDADRFCRQVLEQVTLQAGRAVVSVAVEESFGVNVEEYPPMRRLFVDRALRHENGQSGSMGVSLSLNQSLVAIGAPVTTYYPAVADRLHTRLNIPEHAAIANAVGAVAGGVMQTVRALITLVDSEQETFRVHLPTGISDYDSLDAAADYALAQTSALAEQNARRAGAVQVQVATQRQDQVVDVRGQQIFLGCEISATATGRPRLAER